MSNVRWPNHRILLAVVAIPALTLCAQRAALASEPTCGPGWLWVCSAAFALSWFGTLRWLRFDAWVTGILVSATLLYLGYATYTDVVERNYDGLQHHFYANYIALYWQLPPVNACIACGHPPLYPLLGALAIGFARWTGLSSSQGALQGLSLLLSLAFLVLGVRTLQRLTVNPIGQRMGVALLSFWPSTITQSIRVHDDVMLSCLCAGSLYCLVRWQRDDRSSDFVRAVVVTSLAVFTKANAYAWVILLLLLVTARAIRDKFTRVRVWQAGLGWTAAAGSILLATESRAAKVGASGCHRAIGAICNIATEHFVGNTWANYLTFDVRYFLAQPFLINDPYDPRRDYVLNMLLKSSLFSAVPLGPEFGDRLSACLGILLSYLALGLLAYLLIGLPLIARAGMRERWVLLWASLLMLGQLMALRIKVPLSMHADFRYVFPLLVPVVVAYSSILEYWNRRSRMVFRAGCSLALLTVTTSALFFLPNDARVKGHPEPTLEPIPCESGAFSAVRQSGTPLEGGQVLRFGPRQILEFRLPGTTTVSHLDLSLEAGGQYEVLIRGRDNARRIPFGPKVGVDGLARYLYRLNDPIEHVYLVSVRALQGDGSYALGHLRLTP